MRLRRLKIERSLVSGGLFDGLDVWFERDGEEQTNEPLAPLCLIGPNGSGKSQFLQLLAEIFQAAWHDHAPEQERTSANDDVLFELTYLISPEPDTPPVEVTLVRSREARGSGSVKLYRKGSKDPLTASSDDFGRYLPSIVIGYTSGDNETLSLPFLVSRGGYAKAVREAALRNPLGATVFDNRLMLVDYGTNLEVLFANMLLGDEDARREILEHAGLSDLASCRCTIRLAHSAVSYRAKPEQRKQTGRKKIQLTEELEETLTRLKRSATCWTEDTGTETFTFDFLVTEATRQAVQYFWKDALSLYRALHKFSLLNDLVIKKEARDRMNKAVAERRFATRLPEPLQDDLVFGFEEVRFWPEAPDCSPVDYVALSDGEHQQALILGTYAMISEPNALFLLDEPESHFNPQWRVQFVKRLMELRTGRASQEMLMTTHAPFLASDMSRSQVLVFERSDDGISVAPPEIETYGASYDRILEHCFKIRPPISQIANTEIQGLLESGTVEELQDAMIRLGDSVEKTFLAARLRKLTAEGD